MPFLDLNYVAQNPTLIQLCLNIFASLLGLLSTHLIYHPYGAAILKVLLLQPNLDILNSNISDGSQDVILSALTLFNAMSSFAGGAEKRAVMDGFAWGQKVSINTSFFCRIQANHPLFSFSRHVKNYFFFAAGPKQSLIGSQWVG